MTEALAREVLDAARARGRMIVTAESCTGGAVSAALTDIPGASHAFDRGYVTYSYPSKSAMLGVPAALLAAHGAVSEPVARAMAEGALARAGLDGAPAGAGSDGVSAGAGARVAVAITGVAGPGGSEAKPEGLVWFAIADAAGVRAQRREFGPLGRARVRARCVETALELLLQALTRVP